MTLIKMATSPKRYERPDLTDCTLVLEYTHVCLLLLLPLTFTFYRKCWLSWSPSMIWWAGTPLLVSKTMLHLNTWRNSSRYRTFSSPIESYFSQQWSPAWQNSQNTFSSQKMDRNRDGVVTIDEFIEACQKVGHA